MHCRWYPACLAACLWGEGVVSQHALQVSRPTPRGEVEGSGQGRGVSRLTSKGEVEGSGLGGSPGPHPGGSPGPHLEGVYPSMH